MTTTLLRPGDPRYPALLGAMTKPPEALHVRGTLEAGDSLAVALVGARRATAYGLAVAERLAADLAAAGVTVVSGLARGVDGAAHRGALAAGGRTIAVLGSGIDVVYPPEHRPLARAIEEHGALVSQFPPGTAPLAYNFPARNRTLAGLALGVVVVEASEKSGALITAGFAGDLGREVFAVPGSITSALSAGSNRLIREGATLVRGWTDIVDELPEPWRHAVRHVPGSPETGSRPDDASDEGRVLALLSKDEPQHIEDIIARAPLAPGRTAATLASLEVGGWARRLEGQRWVSAMRRSS